MKRILVYIAIGLPYLLLPFFSAAQVSMALVDPLEPVFPDSNHLAAYSDKLAIDEPMGASADVHLMLQVPPGQSFTVSATLHGKLIPADCWHLLADVPVEENIGLDGHTEKFMNEINPYVIRRAPFRIYEPVLPLEEGRIVAKNAYTGLRLSLPSTTWQAPGAYTVLIEAAGKGWKRAGVFTVRVHPVRLPPVEKGHFFYTNWFNLHQMEVRQHVEPWTPEWYAMLDKYAELMKAGRQNCIIIPGEFLTVREGRIFLDEEKMHNYIEVFRKHGFLYFEAPHIMGKNHSDWSDPELSVNITGRRYYTGNGRADVDTIATLIRQFVEKYKLGGSWYQHISDEPLDAQSRCYREVVAQIRKIYPEVRVIDATMSRDSLAGAVDVWCPLVDDFTEHLDFFQTRQQVYDKVLVYTCLIPGARWLNRAMDQERLRQVYFGWGAAYYHTFGYLHWALNQYTADPWTHSAVKHPGPRRPNPLNFLPAGDSHIIYPGKDGPLTSLRFEAHREGIEDFELLYILRYKNPVLERRLIAQLFRNYADYEVSVAKYRKVKKEMLDAL